jgi:hypothetical protein
MCTTASFGVVKQNPSALYLNQLVDPKGMFPHYSSVLVSSLKYSAEEYDCVEHEDIKRSLNKLSLKKICRPRNFMCG